MFSPITLISNTFDIVDVEFCPLITEVITTDMFKHGEYTISNIVIFDGYETSLFCFSSTSRFSNYKIIDNIYWFYSYEDYRYPDKNYQKDFLEFYKNEINNNVFLTEEIIFNIFQLKDIITNNDRKFIYHNTETNEIFISNLNKDILSIVDVSYFEFCYEFEISNIEDFYQLLERELNLIGINKAFISYKELKVFLKTIGLVDKRFTYDNLITFFSLFNESNERNHHKYIVEFYSKVLSYQINYINNKIIFSDIDNNILEKINNDYSDPWKNIIFVEEYLSNVKINSINFDLYPNLYFPIKDEAVVFEYNGSDSKTGRINTINLNGYQSLQTLGKDKRDVLNAELNCFLIEFDYKSFEFDILHLLSNKFINKDSDPHIEIIRNIFGDEILNDENISDYRALGKKINYAIIYGMQIEKVIDDIISDFFTEEDYEATSTDNILMSLKELLYNKISTSDLFEVIKNVLETYIEPNYNPHTKLLKNYFGRFIRVEKSHVLLNYFIQSLAVDFLCIKFRMIVDLLLYNKVDLNKNKILFQNHDSIFLQLESKIINNTSILEDIEKIINCGINQIIGRSKFSYGSNWKDI